MNATKQNQTLNPNFNTNQILDNIKNKLFNSGNSDTSARTPNNAQQNTTSLPSNSQQNANHNAKQHANNFTYEDFEDFQMNEDFGTEAPASFSKESQTPEINAAYRAYQANNKYHNAINGHATNKTLSGLPSNNFEDFEDFEDISANNNRPLAENDDTSFETETEEDVYESQSNVQSFPQRPQSVSSHKTKESLSENQYAPAQSEKLYAMGSEPINSVMARILQREIASYVSSWSGQNNQVVTKYFQEACNQMAQQWCNENMLKLMDKAVNQWCESNLEELCATVIRQELHKERAA